MRKFAFLKKKRTTCDPRALREGVKEAYSAAARQPRGKHPFPVGRAFAESIGYPGEVLDTIPAGAWEAFVGVSNVAIFADIPPGSVVLDVGCGAGLDSIIAARKTGGGGKVIGVDFSENMLERAHQAVSALSLEKIIEFRQAAAEQLPLEDGSVDIALVNGIFNLNPRRQDVFIELARVVQEQGKVYAAEMVFTEAMETGEVCSLDDWFAWIAGAKESGAFLDEFRSAGFGDVQILRTSKNARTNHEKLVAVDVAAVKTRGRDLPDS